MPQVRGTPSASSARSSRTRGRRPHPAAGGTGHRRLCPRVVRSGHREPRRGGWSGHVSRSTVSTICRELRDRYPAFCNKSLADVDPGASSWMPSICPSGPVVRRRACWSPGASPPRATGCCSPSVSASGSARGLAGPRPGPHPARACAARSSSSPTGHRASSRPSREAMARRRPRSLHRASVAERAGQAARPGRPPCPRAGRLLGGARRGDHARRGARPGCGSSWASLGREYPSAAACLADDLAALTVHLAYPLRLRRRLRSTNLLERSLEEVRRRTKVIGRFPGETSCLTMAWAVMDLVIAGGHGLGLTLPDRHAIAAIVAARSRPADGGADRLT